MVKTGFPGQTGFLGTNPEQKAGTRNRVKRPGLETGEKTGLLKKKKETKTERKRGQNRISGSKIQFQVGNGNLRQEREPGTGKGDRY